MIPDANKPHGSNVGSRRRWDLALTACLTAAWIATPLLGTARAADGPREGDRPTARRDGDRDQPRPEARRDTDKAPPREGADRAPAREGDAPFVAASRITVRAGVVEGWIVAVARAKAQRKELWKTRLGKVESAQPSSVRYDGPFVVVNYGRSRYVLDGRTGKVIPAERLRAMAAEAARRREGAERDRPPAGGEGSEARRRAAQMNELRQHIAKLREQMAQAQQALERLERGAAAAKREGEPRREGDRDRAREGDRRREGDRERAREGEGQRRRGRGHEEDDDDDDDDDD